MSPQCTHFNAAECSGTATRAATTRATTTSRAHRKRLVAVLCITLGVFTFQLVAALLSNSLALLADTGHVLTDAIGVVIALIASIVATLPTNSRRTFGFLRVEVLAALVNGIVLSVVAILIGIQAVARFGDAVSVNTGPMLIAAGVGAAANLCSLLILRRGHSDNLNLRGAYLEVLGDLFGSLTVLVSGVVIALTGWTPIDQIASLLIAVLIAPRAFSLLRDVFAVLLEGTPTGIDLQRVRTHFLAVAGVLRVHDIHAWTITSGVPVFSAHVVVSDAALRDVGEQRIREQLRECLSEHFSLDHVTLECEAETRHAQVPVGEHTGL